MAEVSRRLDGSVIGVTTLNPFAATLSLRPGTLGEAFLRQVVPTLQGRGFSTDLNYLEPALPNNHFRPDDNPVEADDPGERPRWQRDACSSSTPPPTTAAVPGVTTIGPLVDYDVDGNGLVDEDHGHGVYVASLIKRLAPRTRGGAGRRRRRASRRLGPLVADGVLRRRRHRRHRPGLRAVGERRRATVRRRQPVARRRRLRRHRQPPRPRSLPARPRRLLGDARPASGRSTSRPRGTTAAMSSTSRRRGGTGPPCRRLPWPSTW